MKKIISVLICCVLLANIGTVINAGAANINSRAGTVTTSSTSLNIRSSPNTASAVLSSLPKGSYITLSEKSAGWWKVEYKNGQFGYCSANYITEISSQEATVAITSGYLNVRAGAGTSYSAIAKLQKNDAVLILSTVGDWYRILFDGTKTGYVAAGYLKKQNNAATASDAVRLNVPNFKQTDSRWSSVTLGTSGKTLGSIGCTTTCIAMTESYRTGNNIYPDAMSKKLTYSASGSLYWPSNYVTDTSVSLAKIKAQLQKKKPVIVGLKTNAGSMHWVVVTGFDSNNYGDIYYVNDPGSSSRTLLSDVIQKYPQFYKMAYYN